MGKEIIWSPTSLKHLEEIHQDILDVSKSLEASDRVVNDILDSAEILSTQPEIYTLDKNKHNNDGSYRSYQIRNYNVAYRVIEKNIRIIRMRFAGKDARKY
ncbi:type II toxin-antitoxin system RelE/ParE family toxin [Aquimarina agarilytica]|uniref:type II toxin-antitoxin system RelE/ParE family toxin n=1 Tax=Aquimarina agarilytica TaxID=1087449 RepID=UPI000287AB11|nr:type II toxin-antitoxin system RelE/ParE family toxin [Aquimarina agarilytica]